MNRLRHQRRPDSDLAITHLKWTSLYQIILIIRGWLCGLVI